MLRLERAALDDVDWTSADAFPDRLIFQTRPWLEFIAETQGAEPVVAAVKQDGETVGWFSGGIVSRYRVRILGSPFPGWTTMFMGFNLREGVSRREAVYALLPFAFRELGCLHVELRDRHLTEADVGGLRFDGALHATFLLDLTKDEQTLLSEMSGSTRRNIRNGLEKHGIVVEEAHDPAFVDEYYDQLIEVFQKQSLVPTYPRERVRALYDHLHPTGNLLLLRARNPQGEPIASVIFPAFNETAYYWGGASWRAHQKLRPNEALIWTAMRTWKERGMRELDMAGAGAAYKRNYGAVVEVDFPHYRKSRYRAVGAARVAAKKAFRLSLHARGRLRRLRRAA